MQGPDPKCRHFVISWHFMTFWHVCQKANCITKSAFSAFSRPFPPFCLFHRIRLLDFSAHIYEKKFLNNQICVLLGLQLIWPRSWDKSTSWPSFPKHECHNFLTFNVFTVHYTFSFKATLMNN